MHDRQGWQLFRGGKAEISICGLELFGEQLFEVPRVGAGDAALLVLLAAPAKAALTQDVKHGE